MRRTHQQHHGDVQQESAETIEEEREQANVVNLIHSDLGNLPAEGHKEVHDSADRSEVVDGHNRIHLVLGRA